MKNTDTTIRTSSHRQGVCGYTMSGLSLPTYEWRGRTYKSLRGLHNAVKKAHPGCGLSFEEHFMVAIYPSGSAYRYRRRFRNNSHSDIAENYI